MSESARFHSALCSQKQLGGPLQIRDLSLPLGPTNWIGERKILRDRIRSKLFKTFSRVQNFICLSKAKRFRIFKRELSLALLALTSFSFSVLSLLKNLFFHTSYLIIRDFTWSLMIILDFVRHFFQFFFILIMLLFRTFLGLFNQLDHSDHHDQCRLFFKYTFKSYFDTLAIYLTINQYLLALIDWKSFQSCFSFILRKIHQKCAKSMTRKCNFYRHLSSNPRMSRTPYFYKYTIESPVLWIEPNTAILQKGRTRWQICKLL